MVALARGTERNSFLSTTVKVERCRRSPSCERSSSILPVNPPDKPDSQSEIQVQTKLLWFALVMNSATDQK